MLKTVDEHNDEKQKQRQEREEAALRTGVACPKCGEELRWLSQNFWHVSTLPIPTRFPAHCSKCNLDIQLEK